MVPALPMTLVSVPRATLVVSVMYKVSTLNSIALHNSIV